MRGTIAATSLKAKRNPVFTRLTSSVNGELRTSCYPPRFCGKIKATMNRTVVEAALSGRLVL